MTIKANNPALTSWINVEANSDFPIQNLPFGIYSDANTKHHACSAIGNYAIDLYELADLGYFQQLNINKEVFNNAYLNDFIELGKSTTRALRDRLSELLSADNKELQDNKEAFNRVFKPHSAIKLLLPVKVGDYTDFYSSIDHATNIGTMIRDPKNALMPNWKYIPVGYHGRASSITVSGTPLHRPTGQMKPADAEVPTFGPCR